MRAQSIFVGLAILYSGVPWTATATPIGLIGRESNYQEKKVAVVDLAIDQGFWYGNFAVGASRNLSMLVDTGSADVGLNTGNYKPSAQSLNLGTTGQDSYGTTQSNGCGSAVVRQAVVVTEHN